MKQNAVYNALLEKAQELVQSRGYHAFSFKDLSLAVGIKTSSIHYYFPTKADLGKALMAWHTEVIQQFLKGLTENRQFSKHARLEAFLEGIVQGTYYKGHKMCLGGMLAMDTLSMERKVQHEIQKFFQLLEWWLEKTLQEGVSEEGDNVQGESGVKARMLLSALEGALLLSRLFESDQRLLELKASLSLYIA